MGWRARPKEGNGRHVEEARGSMLSRGLLPSAVKGSCSCDHGATGERPTVLLSVDLCPSDAAVNRSRHSHRRLRSLLPQRDMILSMHSHRCTGKERDASLAV